MKKIAITTGDPAGIGPEIAAQELRFRLLQDDCIYVVYGSLRGYFPPHRLQKINRIEEADSTQVVYLIEIDSQIEIGCVSRESGKTAYQILERCVEDCNAGKIDAIVTCPVCKQAIQMEHPEFIGHTEYLAQKTNTTDVTMTFWSKYFQLALLTTHKSISEAASLFTKDFLETKIKLIIKQFDLFCSDYRFAVLGINPHAGEMGAFGKEDVFLAEIIQSLQKEGVQIEGPFPADTFFARHIQDYEVVISAFHDQGLIPFKMLAADQGVNVTLGLPFLRTSVDHGTAFDIAGKKMASEASLASAISFAENGCFVGVENSIYGRFAPFYDNYMKHVDYNNWADYVLRKYQQTCKKMPEKILEIACGTGNVLTRLFAEERELYGMDKSAEMLKIALQKNEKIHYFLGDFTQPIPFGNFDLILLLFDSINYLHHENSIAALFQTVYQALSEKGLFIFDISTILNCEENFDGFVNLEEELHSYMIHQCHFDFDDLVLKTQLTFFIRKGLIYERFDEVHRQKIYRCQQLEKMIKNSPLKLEGIFSRRNPANLLPFLEEDLDNSQQRLYFVLKK